MKRYQKLSILAAVIFAASCDGPISIVPSAAAAVPDQVLKFALSQTVPATVTWSATAGTITGVGNNATYVAPGCAATMPITATITAAAGGKTATAIVTVTDAVDSVTVTPPTVTLNALASTTFVATVKTVCNPTGTVSALRINSAMPVLKAKR